jgi:hypothetical protein
MALKEQLARMKERSASQIPAEVAAVTQRLIEDLRKPEVMNRVLKVGDKAPGFVLPNQNGQVVSSNELLPKGPLVISFFRGKW